MKRNFYYFEHTKKKKRKNKMNKARKKVNKVGNTKKSHDFQQHFNDDVMNKLVLHHSTSHTHTKDIELTD